jgi:uncharacterized protein (DUF1800 family)
MASRGQVAPAGSAAKVSYYAASRFAEQATFGPTPAVIADIQTKGYAAWIDSQFKLAPSKVDLAPYLGFADPIPPEEWKRYTGEFPSLALAGPDQLRLRVTWSLSQFIVVSSNKVDMVGVLYWFNLLQDKGLGRYGDLLYAVSRSPAMGVYLDNSQNRPKSAECPHCAPNENYARELMQLFSLGVFRLNADGTPLKDAQGRLVETYGQKDVEQLARILTGWQFEPEPQGRPNRNWANYGKTMVPSTWPPERDSGAKVLLGKDFPAGQSQDKDLRDAIAVLMAHQNIAPFVATRMIQHLVKSNPTPAYVGRVAARFRNNGSGVAGDMKSVVKAILLDPEARAGDDPTTARADDGKLREPFLHSAALWRGLGCSRFPDNGGNWIPLPPNQPPFGAMSVFSFYAPTDRAPGSNLLAPEQRLLNAQELTSRLNLANGMRWNAATETQGVDNFVRAGCDVRPLVDAYWRSPRDFADQLSQRYFRGAMPPTLRANIEQLIREPAWNTSDRNEGPLVLLDFALGTPYFGVIKSTAATFWALPVPWPQALCSAALRRPGALPARTTGRWWSST